VPSLLRGFSAPVHLRGVPRDRLRFLARHDSDPFARWDAGQRYAVDALLAMAAGAPMDDGLIEAASATLDRADTDHAFAAEALALPSEAILADAMGVVDPDAIHAARQTARAAIAAALRPRFQAAYDRLADNGPYAIDGAAMGRRALRNACLAYLTNMTDQLAALAALCAIDAPERVRALADFHARWRGDPLVLDKWFAMQAMSPLPGALDAVKALAAHPDYDIRNPNRVRSLVSSFAAGNQVRFHAASGAGYDFLADTILEIDPANAQIAARLTTALGQWRRFDAGRQDKMKAALSRIAARPGISTNTYEMAAKSLA
jgi:aminopeptidase N